MLEQLVESKDSYSENKRRAGFLTTTLFTVAIIAVSALTYSLFAKDLGADNDGLELSSLVAPVPISNDAPPKPKIKIEPQKQSSAPNQTTQITRREAFATIENSTKPPANLIGEKDVQSWVKGATLGKINSTPTINNSDGRNKESVGTGISQVSERKDETTEPPPVVPPVRKVEPKVEEPKKPEEKKLPMQTGGVLNGKAIDLVKPAYPPTAKAVKASGAVNVQVTIDEQGNVVSASAVSGHPLLRQAAEKAARSSKFSPTYLSKIPVKVTGVIVYNFVAQ